MSENKRPVAVIDSGLGGISVLRHLVRELPSEDFIYFGDTANAPYGFKTSEEVCALTISNVGKLISEYSVKAVVIACNTATGAAAEKCRETFTDVPIIGIEPAVKPAVTQSEKENPTVLVMATPLTLSQDKFVSLVEKYNPKASLISLPCPGLSDVIEMGADETEVKSLLSELFSSVTHEKIDSIVLGCTHYPLVSEYISEYFPNARVYDGGLGTALQTKRRLAETDMLASDGKKGRLTVLNSSNSPEFEKKALKFLEK